jgi:hypothetical protein
MPHAFINRPYQRTFDALDNICKIVNSNIWVFLKN